MAGRGFRQLNGSCLWSAWLLMMRVDEFADDAAGQPRARRRRLRRRRRPTAATALFHDVLWPHARRDTYYAPERIRTPRQPLGHNIGLVPGNPDTNPLGLPFVGGAP